MPVTMVFTPPPPVTPHGVRTQQGGYVYISGMWSAFWEWSAEHCSAVVNNCQVMSLGHRPPPPPACFIDAMAAHLTQLARLTQWLPT